MQPLSENEQRHMWVTQELDWADPIWGQPAKVYQTGEGAVLVLSDRSGSFLAPTRIRELLQHWPEAAKARLVTWILNQNLLGERYPKLWPDVLQAAVQGKPMRFRTKVEGFFRYLADRSYRPGDYLFPQTNMQTAEGLSVRHAIMRWTEATGDRELNGLMSTLEAERLIENVNGLRLTGKGLERLDDLDASGAANDQGFVAMWFGEGMDEVYEQGIEPALTDVGYRAFRIDRKEHANKIDDEIIAEIRRSRFVVADFTCGTARDGEAEVGIPRGGVYYEAGFAQGLGMPVIWTVREDQIGLVHFDTRQFNHIAWKNPEDLRTKLARRIGAVIGDFREGR